MPDQRCLTAPLPGHDSVCGDAWRFSGKTSVRLPVATEEVQELHGTRVARFELRYHQSRALFELLDAGCMKIPRTVDTFVARGTPIFDSAPISAPLECRAQQIEAEVECVSPFRTGPTSTTSKGF